VDVLGQFQTSYDSMCNLISNILHNLAHYQRDATQCDKVNMLILYVSYQHAFEVFWSWIVYLRDGGGSDVHWSFAKHNTSMGKSKRSIVWKKSWDWNLIYFLTHVLIQLTHLEKNTKTTLVPNYKWNYVCLHYFN
jgi:hypothetical protein